VPNLDLEPSIEANMPNDPEATLSPTETENLRRIAGLMIPASEEHGVPAADDPLIFADIVRSLGRDLADVRAALAELSALAGGGANLDTFGALSGPGSAVLGGVILQCYYRDDRVLHSLGVEPRPPFPKGHTVEQGDWSLLDTVRRRPRLWRDDRES
jgi:hypothetical protein